MSAVYDVSLIFERKIKIMTSVLDVIAEQGVVGATYRRIAKRAGVTLGTLTYKFDSIEQLIESSFIYFAEANPSLYLDVLEDSATDDQVLGRLVDMCCCKCDCSIIRRTISISYELSAYASKNSAMVGTVGIWRRRNQEGLSRRFGLLAGKLIDALLEGFLLEKMGGQPSIRHSDLDHMLSLLVKNVR